VDGACSTNGEKRNVYGLLVRKPEGKGTQRRSKRRWVDNIKMNLVEIELGSVDLIVLAQDRKNWRILMNAVINIRVPLNAGNLPSGCTTGGLSSGTQLHRVSYAFRMS
jgi:hypothetical protein